MINSKGFTIIELIVVIAIMAILSGVVLLSVTKYVSIGKDSNIKANLSVLITDGEAFYNANSTYNNFCDSDAVTNAFDQMPSDATPYCDDGVGAAWAACAQEFSDTSKYYCVDSTGKHEEVCGTCVSSTACPATPGC